MSERFDVLDGLRGCAILIVVWYHAWMVSGAAVPFVNFAGEAGLFGVELFFFISGFCLYAPFARAAAARRPAPSTRRFFRRRALKIVPSYLLVLAVFAWLYRERFASPADTALQLFSHLAFLHPLSPATFGAISGPLWTVGIEVEFYLIFPLLAGAMRARPLATYAALFALGEGYRIALAGTWHAGDFWAINQLPAFLDLFGAGMLAAHFLATPQPWLPPRNRTLTTAAALLAAAIAVGGLGFASAVVRGGDAEALHVWMNAYRVAIGPLCIVLALATHFGHPRWRACVAAPPLVFLSTISYNLYLWHLEIAVGFRDSGLPPAAIFALAAVTATAVATLVTYAIERPILFADTAALAARLRFTARAGATGRRSPAS